ncbi:quercetin dioxygenase-like cupin family protein [Chitinophaga dinghuensis]|uniref:Quercetin dioxygenase-like cupin family protein n=1 Tax=Chitinophaga dinghuensis TaxID=1539050 RepID=A0A327W1Z7_9BACT|nr:cupin domain-containing protein [Chitinophaga dinghuensis]RAJ82306.1 quercetin dioxygenase-like cupin family protein [Chitinophaga dinghuensis]
MVRSLCYWALITFTILMACSDANQSSAGKSQHSNLIFPVGQRVTNGNFTGTTYLYSLIEGDSVNGNSVGNVTFAAGSRSKWHLHPAGQILLAIDGVGYYQEKGKSKIILRKGDAIKCPPNVIHWHGASIDSPFVQIAITGREKGPTQWFEEVTEEDYSSTPIHDRAPL